MQHPQTKLLKAGSAIRLSFNQLQAMDLSLGLSIAVGGFKGTIDRIVIAIDTCCQTAQFCNSACLSLFEPARQSFYLPLRDHDPKILCQMIGSPQFFILDAQRL